MGTVSWITLHVKVEVVVSHPSHLADPLQLRNAPADQMGGCFTNDFEKLCLFGAKEVQFNFYLGVFCVCGVGKARMSRHTQCSPYSNQKQVCVGYPTQMKLTQTT